MHCGITSVTLGSYDGDVNEHATKTTKTDYPSIHCPRLASLGFSSYQPKIWPPVARTVYILPGNDLETNSSRDCFDSPSPSRRHRTTDAFNIRHITPQRAFARHHQPTGASLTLDEYGGNSTTWKGVNLSTSSEANDENMASARLNEAMAQEQEMEQIYESLSEPGPDGEAVMISSASKHPFSLPIPLVVGLLSISAR